MATSGRFSVTCASGIYIFADANDATATRGVGDYLAALLRPAFRCAVPVTSGTPSGDTMRFTYRAAGLDVTRHFSSVADVERYIDEVSLYK